MVRLPWLPWDSLDDVVGCVAWTSPRRPWKDPRAPFGQGLFGGVGVGICPFGGVVFGGGFVGIAMVLKKN